MEITNKTDILIVDDNIMNQKVLAAMLKEQGYRAHLANSGDMALTVIRKAPPDLILLDIVMPDIDGLEVCEQLKADEQTRDIPVIFISGQEDIDTKITAFAVGGVDYITKPFQVQEVLTRVETHLALRAMQKQLEEKNIQLKQYSEQLEEMVTERTQKLQHTQEQLVRQEKLAGLGQLAGSVAHELRNPLNVLSNAIYFLHTTLTDANEKTQEYLDIISTEIRKSNRITTDLLNFSRARPPERENVEISTLVTRVMAEQLPPEEIELATVLAPDLPSVFIDPEQIEQVLNHLITNAYQSMPDGGKLTVSAELGANSVAASVADTGCGISPNNMDKLFEPLFTTKAKGIGLGLAVSKSLVESNEGTIEVTSEENKGSIFTIRLPIGE
jgi:signal transduction histidine kinase